MLVQIMRFSRLYGDSKPTFTELSANSFYDAMKQYEKTIEADLPFRFTNRNRAENYYSVLIFKRIKRR